MKNKERGTALMLEMLILVAILAIVAAMAVPNLSQQLLDQQEGVASSNLRTMTLANFDYFAVNNSYAPNVQALTTAKLSIPAMTPISGTTMGRYLYTYTVNGANGYTYTATPVNPKAESFYTDQTGIVTMAPAGQVATSASTPLTYFPKETVPGPPGPPGKSATASAPGILSMVDGRTYVGQTGGPQWAGLTGASTAYILTGSSTDLVTLPPVTPGTDNGKTLTFTSTVSGARVYASDGENAVAFNGQTIPAVGISNMLNASAGVDGITSFVPGETRTFVAYGGQWWYYGTGSGLNQ